MENNQIIISAITAMVKDVVHNEVGQVVVRLDRLEKRFDGLENRFDGLENRFDVMEKRFDTFEQKFLASEELIMETLAEIKESVTETNMRLENDRLLMNRRLDRLEQQKA